MSYPSFYAYLRTLRELLRRSSPALHDESMLLADMGLAYGQMIGLSEQEKKSLFLAAYYKNLGMVCGSNGGAATPAERPLWLEDSIELAQAAGLDEVVTILSQYPHHAIPANKLARLFQVLNAWVVCLQQRGWQLAIEEREAAIILEQRAHLGWADPAIVAHFVAYCPMTERPATPQAG